MKLNRKNSVYLTMLLGITAFNHTSFAMTQPTQKIVQFQSHIIEHEALYLSPLEHKQAIHPDNFKNLTWISENMLGFALQKSGNLGEIGYINFCYYNQPQRIPDLASKIGKQQYHNDCDGYIYELHINQEDRRQGFGEQLFKKAINTMLAIGCKKIVWNAYPFDLSADKIEEEQRRLNKWYKKLGGQKIDSNNPKENYYTYAPR